MIKLYDTHDDFNLSIVNYPFLCCKYLHHLQWCFCIQGDLIRKAMLNVHVRSISNTKTATDNQVGIVLPEVVLHKQRSHLCQRRKYSLSHDEGRISTGKNFLGKF